MTSAISSNNGSYSSYGMSGMRHRPDASQMAEKIFSKLDTKNQGYIDKSDLESAFSQLSGSNTSSDSSATVDDILKQFDGDSDGKITKDEMTSGIKKLADELNNQFGQMRMSGFGGQGQGGPEGMRGMGMPPGPPPQGGPGGKDNAGFTKDELTNQLQEMGSTDGKHSSLISNIVNNFDKADTDGDGKVSGQEAMAFDKSSETDSPSDGASSNSSTVASESSQAKLMHTIMQLMQTYGNSDQSANQSAVANLISAAA